MIMSKGGQQLLEIFYVLAAAPVVVFDFELWSDIEEEKLQPDCVSTVENDEFSTQRCHTFDTRCFWFFSFSAILGGTCDRRFQ